MEIKVQKFFERNDRKMVNKKVVIVCSIIALIIVGGIVGIQIKKLNEIENVGEVQDTAKQNTSVNQNLATSNEMENTGNEEQNITQENTSEQTQIKGEEEKEQEPTEENTANTSNTEEMAENNNLSAIDLAKKQWGEDDSVYYTIDHQSNEIYTISVRSKSTTEQLAEYEVDVKEQTAVIK